MQTDPSTAAAIPVRSPLPVDDDDDGSAPGDDLRTRLEKVLDAGPLTPRQLWLERVSYVFGKLSTDNPDTLPADVERMAIEKYGPCPPE